MHSLRFARLLVLSAGICVPALVAQQRGGAGPSPTAGAGNTAGSTNTGNSTGVGTRNNTNPFPGTNSSIYNNPNIESTRPIFLSGRVVMDDGNKPSSDISIQRVCYGSPHTEAHTDSKGHFSFQVGGSGATLMDASESSMDPSPRYGANSSMMNQGIGGQRTISARDLNGCQIQASYPGYRSDAIDLYQRRSLDNPDIGVIVLHRLGNVQGTAISITSELAPKKARKAYEKALQLESKEKFDEAAVRLQEAVTEYPKYAIAWQELGRLQRASNKPEEARKSFQAAIAADGKYVNPYDSLAGLEAQQGKWQEAADQSKHAVYLNPVEYPSSWYYNALANYNLKHSDVAEKSAKEVLKLDGAHKLPQVHLLLAQVNVERSNYTEAAQHIQTYLQLAPNAPNTATLKEQLAKLQATIAQTQANK